MRRPRRAPWGVAAAPHSPGKPGPGQFPPGRAVALIGLGDGQVGRKERASVLPTTEPCSVRPASFQAPCAVQMENVNYRPRMGAPGAPKQPPLDGASSLDTADRGRALGVLPGACTSPQHRRASHAERDATACVSGEA